MNKIGSLLTRAEIDRKNARLLVEMAMEADDDVPMRSTPGGDARRLRGIPAVGRNVSGAIPGTRPDKISA